jgi:hypothetical protein
MHVQSTFEDTNKVKKAGQRLTRIRQGRRSITTHTQFTAFLRRQESAFVGTSASVSTVADNQSDDDRMEVDINRIRAPRKKPAKDECARCGKKGHWAKDCKVPKKTPIVHASTGRPVGVKTAQARSGRSYQYWSQLDEESEEDAESSDDE